jgi:hypothetical protein
MASLGWVGLSDRGRAVSELEEEEEEEEEDLREGDRCFRRGR